MEKIIRKILNYPREKASKKERSELIANVVALSLSLLSKKGYEFPDDCAKVVFAKISDSADSEYNFLEKHIMIDKLFFTQDDALYNDLPLLAHEVCHLAQDYDPHKKTSIPNMVYVDPVEVENLIAALGVFYDEESEIASLDDLQNLANYIYSYYYLQDYEFKAYQFMIEVFNFVINTAKNMELSPYEKQTLDIMTSNNVMHPMANNLMKHKRLRQSKKVAQKSQELINRFLTDWFKDHPNALDSFKLKKEDQLVTNMLCWMVPALMVGYNDEIAHKYFNALAKSKLKYVEQDLVFLVQKTKIQLTPDEVKLLLPFIEKFNKEYDSTLTYDIILSEKARFLQDNARIAGEDPIM